MTAQRRLPLPPQAPREVIHVKAIPEREALEICFPRVQGYRVELPEERLEAEFNSDSTFVLNPDVVGPSMRSNVVGTRVKSC